jgi:hypothetical protein
MLCAGNGQSAAHLETDGTHTFMPEGCSGKNVKAIKVAD